MDPRDLARGNGVSLSIAVRPVYMNWMSGTNWGVPTGPSFVLVLDPQLNVDSSKMENAAEPGMERGARRRLMGELANEFTVLHDNLLYELAR